MTTIIELAPAKTNYTLNVLYKRPDGFHELQTLMQALTLADKVEISSIAAGVRYRGPAELPTGDDNLVVAAAKLMQSEFKAPTGVALVLTKMIPVSAGLGGGSSDAAAVILGLNRLWGLNLSTKELVALGAQLGSDIPFFLCGSGVALACGRGEHLQPLLALPAHHLLLVKPPFGLSAGAVYQGGNFPRQAAPSRQPLAVTGWPSYAALTRGICNDLEASALKLAPTLATIKAELCIQGADSTLLSGSGSTAFGVFATAAKAEAARAKIAAGHPEYWLHVTAPRADNKNDLNS